MDPLKLNSDLLWLSVHSPLYKSGEVHGSELIRSTRFSKSIRSLGIWFFNLLWNEKKHTPWVHKPYFNTNHHFSCFALQRQRGFNCERSTYRVRKRNGNFPVLQSACIWKERKAQWMYLPHPSPRYSTALMHCCYLSPKSPSSLPTTSLSFPQYTWAKPQSFSTHLMWSVH